MWRLLVRRVHTAVGSVPPLKSEAMAFPCLDKLEQRTNMIRDEGPEPAYSKAKGFELYEYPGKLQLDYGKELDRPKIAYETWGRLNKEKDNAILLHTGLSASSHAKSHPRNPDKGWWEEFVGPGKSVDTDKFFVICTNVIGSCFGSTGPSSLEPSTDERYATRFPLVTINDMVRIQYSLAKDHLKIPKLYASVGSSMGGMQSLAFTNDFPDYVGRVASISACARSHPSSIAMRHVQRQVLMADPNWNRGFYYDGVPPHVGMKLAREIGTITYRSGPEWEERFGRDRADPSRPPALCPDFLIETYLDHQGEKFCLTYDANSLLYVSKAMDIFDMGAENAATRKLYRDGKVEGGECVPADPYVEQPRHEVKHSGETDLADGMRNLANKPAFVLGVQSDALFPSWQQRDIADILKSLAKDPDVVQYHELGYDISKFGHDTFLLDTKHVGKPLKEFLELEM